MKNKPPVITIDGLSGAGKTILCQKIAKILKWNILHSGIIYRMLAIFALYKKINLACEKSLISLYSKINLNFFEQKEKTIFLLKKQNIIYNLNISNIASKISSFPKLRKMLLLQQRNFRKYPGLIAEGRDMGTVVFSDAKVKIFLISHITERVKRRIQQLQKLGFNVNFKKVLYEINKRDDRDCNRNYAPLIPAKDAFILDSTNINIEELVKKSFQYILKQFTLLKY